MFRCVALGFALLLFRVEGIVKGAGVAKTATTAEINEGAEDPRRSALRAGSSHKTHEHVVVASSRSDEAAPLSAAQSTRYSLHTALGTDQISLKLLFAYGFSIVVMVLIVTGMFFPMGRAVVFQVVLYVMCLAFVKIVVKGVYKFDFHYPKFVTSLHLLVSSLAAFVVLLYRSYRDGTPIVIPTSEEFIWRLMPIALTFGLSIGSENCALVYVSAAFSEVVACSNPVMSALVTWLCGLPFNPKLLLPITVVVAGCVVSVTGELFFSTMGLTLLCFSVFNRALKAVMQQQLMCGETKAKFDPVTLMAWTCLCSCGLLAMYSVVTEGLDPIHALRNAPDLTALIIAIAFSCVVACTLNISALFVIRQLGAVGMQMVSQMKAILVVIGGMTLLQESFTASQQGGFVMVLFGVYWYSRWKLSLEEPAAKTN